MVKRFALFLAVLAVCAALGGCNTRAAFEGNMVSSGDSISMDYTLLNQQKDGDFILSQGDSLRVVIAQTTGTVDVTIKMEGQEPLYQGSDLTIADFSLDIPVSGTYHIVLTGHKAAGSVSFIKVEGKVESQTLPEADLPDQSAAYQAYQAALLKIVEEHVYPDGTDTGFDSVSGKMEDNHFAIFDIDRDGRDELIVQFVTAPMAGNKETIFTYDAEENTLATLLQVFPAVTYYDNGVVKEEWSHGSGLAGEDYWPYNLYRRSTGAGEYTLFAEVNMWSRSVDTVDYKGDPYPEEIDTENAGTVFILSRDGKTETVSKSAYEAWLSECMKNALPVEVPYQPLREENIHALSPQA